VAAGAAAHADCRDELAQMQQGIAKDGGLAPLANVTSSTPQQTDGQQTDAQTVGSQSADEGRVAKDGTQMPMGADPDVATSADDAQAQQEGGATAAGVASGAATAGDDKAGALEEATSALERGDEAACLEAIERAKS
jgi:hypothetical protein